MWSDRPLTKRESGTLTHMRECYWFHRLVIKPNCIYMHSSHAKWTTAPNYLWLHPGSAGTHPARGACIPAGTDDTVDHSPLWEYLSAKRNFFFQPSTFLPTRFAASLEYLQECQERGQSLSQPRDQTDSHECSRSNIQRSFTQIRQNAIHSCNAGLGRIFPPFEHPHSLADAACRVPARRQGGRDRRHGESLAILVILFQKTSIGHFRPFLQQKTNA